MTKTKMFIGSSLMITMLSTTVSSTSTSVTYVSNGMTIQREYSVY